MNKIYLAALPAIAAAFLFGASTPFAKFLLGSDSTALSPFMLAGLLYLGSGLGLTFIRIFRDRGFKSPGMPAHEWPWLLLAVLFGGVLGPVLLMLGLAHTSSATASLFLNLEAVLTALLAWLVFKESADRRIVVGMLAIVAGGAVLSWPSGEHAASVTGPLALGGACLAWAIDNNLTRKVSASDAIFIAAIKGVMAGCVNTGLALFLLGAEFPHLSIVFHALIVGFFGYGLSLVFFVIALRNLGTARSGAYFSVAPFVGAAISVIGFGESTSPSFWVAGALMAAGVWLHLTEHHEHHHDHESMTHEHMHKHDLHHEHEHDFDWDDSQPHSHFHSHTNMSHRHPHFPDVHHRHTH